MKIITNLNVRGTTTLGFSSAGVVTSDASGNLTSSSTIAQSSVTNLTTDLAAKLPLGGGTMTGIITGKTNTGGAVAVSNDSGALSVRGDNTNSAAMSFHRPGLYAINMGLDTDNNFVIGGWSASATAFVMSGSGNLTLAGALTNTALNATKETTNIRGTAFAGSTIDVLSGSVVYHNVNATASGTINFRGSSTVTLNSMLAVGQSLTVAVIIQNGATAYYPNAYQIDGVAVTPKWSGGTAPTAGNASSNDIYSYTITKTAATPTYVVWATQTKFGA